MNFSSYVPLANESTAYQMNASVIHLIALTVIALLNGIKNHRAYFKFLIVFLRFGTLCLGLALAISGFLLDWTIIVSLIPPILAAFGPLHGLTGFIDPQLGMITYCVGVFCSICGFWIGKKLRDNRLSQKSSKTNA